MQQTEPVNELQFQYLKRLSDKDTLSDTQRKEYVALLKQMKELQPKKVLDSLENL